jgi:hypothetical protein
VKNTVKLAFEKWKGRNSSDLIKSIIDDIQIMDIKEANLPFIRSDVLRETRELRYRQVYWSSLEVEAINNNFSGRLPDNLNIWADSLTEPKGYVSTSHEHVLEDSKRAETCNECGGNGEVECYSCSGFGEENCSSCGGSGRLYCSSCGGDGYCTSCRGSGYHVETRSKAVEWRESDGTFRSATEWYDVEVSCSSCGGSGSCHCGDGTVVCGSCGGSGIVECSSCWGSGKNTCNTCNGNGALLEYHSIIQEYHHQRYLEDYGSEKFSKKFVGLKEMLEKHLVEDNSIGKLGNNSYLKDEKLFEFIESKLDGATMEKYLGKVKSLVDEISSNGNKSPVMQSTEIFSVAYMIVDYEYKNEKFTLAIDPKTYEIFYDVSPVENYFSGELASVSTYMEQSKYLNAYEMLVTLNDIRSNSSNKEDVEKKYNQVKKKLESLFRYGALGGYFAVLLIKILNPFISYTKDYGFNFNFTFRTIVTTAIWIFIWKKLSKRTWKLGESIVNILIKREIYHTVILPILGVAIFSLISRIIMTIYFFIIYRIF